jgi:L-fuculose-phosphate aldolase
MHEPSIEGPGYDGQQPSTDAALRADLIDACRELARRGLTHGTSGNISLRRSAGEFFLSPSGMRYEGLEPADVPLMELAGGWFGRRRPSTEWRIHRDILVQRPEVNAVVHTHSAHATALACTGRGIPAFHYMVAVAGGPDIRCAPYQPFGSQALSAVAMLALEGRMACLLAHHGVIACGRDLRSALSLAGEVENLAAQYCVALAIGNVEILDAREMALVIDQFRSYGKPDAADPGLYFAGPELPDSGMSER